MKPNFTSTPSRSRPRLFSGCRAPSSGAPLPGATGSARPPRASAGPRGERLGRVRPMGPHPGPEDIDMHVQVPSRLRHRHPALRDRLRGLNLELPTEPPSCTHGPPPDPKEHLRKVSTEPRALNGLQGPEWNRKGEGRTELHTSCFQPLTSRAGAGLRVPLPITASRSTSSASRSTASTPGPALRASRPDLLAIPG